MIAELLGSLVDVEIGFVYVFVNGVTYEVNVAFKTFERLKNEIGTEVHLYIFHSITDRSQKLYGFLDQKEKEIFKLMKSLSGIGEVTALRVLSFLTVDELYNAVVQNNRAVLEKIPKVRGKTSEKIIFEVKQNIKKFESFLSGEETSVSSDNNQRELSVLALVQLGFDEKTAQKEVAKVLKEKGMLETAEVVREVLRSR
ncbi:MAG: Holliday junction branch migration protein RuvA [Leptospiraceae bacterium]|nr:Holliday junction branch migration protein RuvA [Leptospiraceae bacterium]MCP5497333.1 Holliday junction branch migration protein RuvA [Leptospiraceae bacterium]